MFILAVSGLCCCVCFSVVVESGGYCSFQWGGFLVAVASSVADVGLQSAEGSSGCSTWAIEGEKVEAVTDFFILASITTVDCACSHEIRK